MHEPTDTEQRIFENLQVPAFLRQLFGKLPGFFRNLIHGREPVEPNVFQAITLKKLERLRAEGDFMFGMKDLERAKEQAAKGTSVTMPVIQ